MFVFVIGGTELYRGSVALTDGSDDGNGDIEATAVVCGGNGNGNAALLLIVIDPLDCVT